MEGILFLLFIGGIQVLGAWIKKKQEAKKLEEARGGNRPATPPPLTGSETEPPPDFKDPIKAFLETLTGETFDAPKPVSRPVAYNDDDDENISDQDYMEEDEFEEHEEDLQPVYHDDQSENYVSEISDFKEDDIVLGAAKDQDWSQDDKGADPFLKEKDLNAQPLAGFQRAPDKNTLKNAMVWKFILEDCKAKQKLSFRRY